MTPDSLRFVHSTRPPAADVRVFDSLTRSFLGTEFTFRVIGSSHYVSAPAYDFYELSSCEPIPGTDPATVPLDAGPDSGVEPRRFAFETDDLRCETVVERRPLAAFPTGESFDLAYWFGDDAVTTVSLDADGYETYHTYPEFDLVVYSRTVFEAVPAAATSAAALGESPSPTD